MIALMSIPRRQSGRACGACAALSGALRHHGFETGIFDLQTDMMGKVDKYKVEEWALGKEPDAAVVAFVDKYLESLIEKRPTTIALSFLSFHSQIIGKYILTKLRTMTPAEIVIGGSGIMVPMIETVNPIRSFNCGQSFAQEMLEEDLIDYYFYGEGEEAIIDFMNGDRSKFNTTDTTRLEDLDAVPFPDYTDWKDNIEISVTGSRGCVRACTFCDVANLWPTFRYRSADSIVAEMLSHGRKRIAFTDSLVNGNGSEFKKMVGLLANKGIEWEGQYIARKKNFMKPEDYDNLKASGCQKLFIGIESGSEKIRDHMKKKFSNEDLYYELDHLTDRKIHVTALMIVGYPIETEDDFNESLDLVTKYKHCKDYMNWSFSYLQLIHGTPLIDMPVYDNLSTNGETDWTSPETGDYDNRIRRWAQATQLAVDYGFYFDEYSKRRARLIMERASELSNV